MTVSSHVSTRCKQHNKISSSEESDNNEIMDTSNIVEINQEVQRLAMKILQLNKINKSNVNSKWIANVLPVGVISMLICKIEKNEEENEEDVSIDCMQFIEYLGGVLSEKVYEDPKNIRFFYQHSSYILQMNNLDFIYNHNVWLVQFLLGLKGIDLKTASDKEHYAFACMIESIYHLWNLNVLLPHSFIYNLVQFYTSGFPIQGVPCSNPLGGAPRSTQPFILSRSIKWVPGISGNSVVKSKLPPWSGSSLEAVQPHP